MANRLLSSLLLLAASSPVFSSPVPFSDIPLSNHPRSFSISRRAANPPQALPQRAPPNDIRYQPSLDFDTDGCYNVPAIGADGRIVEGLEHNFVSASSNCRDLSDLDNNNVYSRARCNNGWCVYLYDYYFEKDVAIPNFFDAGHTHDWEHIAVWVKIDTGKAEYVAVSQHGGYEIKKASDVRWDGEHPKVVYHKDGASTHCFRFASAGDDKIENHKGVWFRGALVGFNGFPDSGLRERLFGWDFGKATIAIKDGQFAGNLGRAKPSEISGFDVNRDDGSPGFP
ncbi:necrosis inducing protein-domain-containing protein [Rhypophila decipiens]|uniref:Necrosis inducing protein-domain-containing protein n=1 Tax=Rhypophila decipiens TaxID=261697 RepID=A0AAN6Y2M3_9PEZI|nr:necrosis inducing protein-domain-containing protein [Rhypophila decipiens]